MGGKGSGGARVGAGRKSKSETQHWLGGDAGKRRCRKAAPLPVVDEFDAPNDLTVDERNVWLELAPGAFQARTLTRGTAYAFKLLCRNVLLEATLRIDAEKCGGPDHRGILQRVEAGLSAFSIRAMGKPIVLESDKPEDPFDEFGPPEGVQ